MSYTTANNPGPLPFAVGNNELSPSEAMVLADQIRALLEGEMDVESIQLGRDPALEGVIIVRGRLLKPSEELFPRWLEALTARGFTPILRPASRGQQR